MVISLYPSQTPQPTSSTPSLHKEHNAIQPWTPRRCIPSHPTPNNTIAKTPSNPPPSNPKTTTPPKKHHQHPVSTDSTPTMSTTITPTTLLYPRCGHTRPLTTISPLPSSSSTTTTSPKPLCPPCYLREESRILAQYSADLTNTVVRAKKELWSPDETERACEELYAEFTERFWGFEGECGGGE